MPLLERASYKKFKNLSFFLFFITLPSFGQSIEDSRKILSLISEFANEICEKVPLSSSSNTLSLSGKVNADVSKLLKKIADIGIDGELTFSNTESNGFLQKDLEKTVRHSTNCRLEIWKDLKDKVLPKQTRPNLYKDFPETRDIVKDARKELANIGVDWTNDAFGEALVRADARVVELFFLGGWKHPYTPYGTYNASKMFILYGDTTNRLC
ncbi:hypothetical protein [Alteromonas sp. a30]|uniref:hypothetical protein n=1 Tax=Alteromonas sp. a30 TaxID=2730917 RepID=UPI002280DE06|nr:hypothetical protein [Alteromonas sp. a30]MCY7297430.1 hypothetical protein [Alteromonas sp. a30]